MKKFQRILVFKFYSNHEIDYSLIRIYLGAALFVRGILLFASPGTFTELAGAQSFYLWYSFIVGAHIIGGCLLSIGLFNQNSF